MNLIFAIRKLIHAHKNFKSSESLKTFEINLKLFCRIVNAYKATIKFIDDVNRKHILMQVFYTFSKIFQNIIVKFF